jgi:hypothetical protein
MHGSERRCVRTSVTTANQRLSRLLYTTQTFQAATNGKYPSLPKNLTQGYHSIVTSPLLWHKFDNCLCNFLQSKVSYCLHVYFLWRHHLSLDKSENDQDSDSDWFTYCVDIWLLTSLLSLQYLSESCFGNDNKFGFHLHVQYPTFYSLKILFIQLFSLRCHPLP